MFDPRTGNKMRLIEAFNWPPCIKYMRYNQLLQRKQQGETLENFIEKKVQGSLRMQSKQQGETLENFIEK